MKAAAMNRIAWMIGQALAIGGLTWGMTHAPHPPGPMDALSALVISIVLVAFGTAVITNLWDWATRPFRARRGCGPGHADDPPQHRVGAARSGLGRGEGAEQRAGRRIG